MSKLNYSFENDYSGLSSIYCPFTLKNRFGDNIVDPDYLAGFTNTAPNVSSVYTGQFGGFTIIPSFLSADSNVSDVKYFVDFGDGTVVQNTLSSFHQYELPGDYNVTLVVYTSSGQIYRSSQTLNLKVRDVVSDKIILSKTTDNQNASESTVQFFITRFNNVTSSYVLSSSNYKINLAAKGNITSLVGEKKYLADDTFQYTTSSFFFNEIGKNFKVIDSVETDSTNIYAEYINKEIIFSYEPTINNFFVGTSGIGSFYFYEPTTSISMPLYPLV